MPKYGAAQSLGSLTRPEAAQALRQSLCKQRHSVSQHTTQIFSISMSAETQRRLGSTSVPKGIGLDLCIKGFLRSSSGSILMGGVTLGELLIYLV